MGGQKVGTKPKQRMVQAQRRERVAQLLARKHTMREIPPILASEGLVNPTNGKPWTFQVVHLDKKAIEKEWHDRAFQHIDEHKSRIMAELQEVQRAGWDVEDLKAVLDALRQQRGVMGTDAPQKQEFTGGLTVNIVNFTDGEPDDGRG